MSIMKKILAAIISLTMCAAMFTACGKKSADTDGSSQPADGQQSTAEIIDEGIDLGNGLKITDIGAYTGMYMEDGSDEIVSGVMMMIVANTGDKTVQYAKITLEAGETDGVFELTTLPAGASVVLLEQTRMAYDKNAVYETAVTENFALFAEEPSKMEDTVKVQILDDVINVTNISDSDIDGEIVIYYKNSASDLYYGGITYRTRVTGGLAKGEIRQIAGAHASKTGSELMFVQII
jgi:hypothetical protein